MKDRSEKERGKNKGEKDELGRREKERRHRRNRKIEERKRMDN